MFKQILIMLSIIQVSSFVTNKPLQYITKSCIKCKMSTFDYIPKSSHQTKYDEFLKNSNLKIVIGNGPAGTGKTYLACKHAISKFKSKEISKIIVTRPVKSVEEELGFLPGDINEKMTPWMNPVFDIFREDLNDNEIKYLQSEKKLEIAPLGFMRGRTFKNSFIIADEMQNSTPTQMLMLLTRLGENSKIALTGDLKQSDIESINGFEDLIQKLNIKYQGEYHSMLKDQIALVNFKNSDIIRSPVVSKIINLYEN